jgi:hypothetical protein
MGEESSFPSSFAAEEAIAKPRRGDAEVVAAAAQDIEKSGLRLFLVFWFFSMKEKVEVEVKKRGFRRKSDDDSGSKETQQRRRDQGRLPLSSHLKPKRGG